MSTANHAHSTLQGKSDAVLDAMSHVLNVSSCFGCGKIAEDFGDNLSKCGKCKAAWYCNKECQRGNFKDHNLICRNLVVEHPGPGGVQCINQ
jgi:hypothetical protein